MWGWTLAWTSFLRGRRRGGRWGWGRQTITCLCVRKKIGGGGGEWEREGHCCCYDPLGLPGLHGGGQRERERERERGGEGGRFTVRKTGLAYGEESWLTEHLDAKHKNMHPSALTALSLLTFPSFSSGWCPETKSCAKFNPCQCHLTENLSNCWITQSVISSEANSGALDFFFFFFFLTLKGLLLLWSG